MNQITDEKLKKYLSITKEAYEMAKNNVGNKELAEDFLDMIDRYVRDAEHFRKNNNYINSFAALNYAHGWLDAGARIGLFDVKDSRLFTVDDE